MFNRYSNRYFIRCSVEGKIIEFYRFALNKNHAESICRDLYPGRLILEVTKVETQ